MYSNIFDTHAHYDDSRFDEDREALLLSLKDKGVSEIINCACDYKSCLTTLEISDKYDFVFASIGVHPHEAEELTDSDFEKIKELFKKEI